MCFHRNQDLCWILVVLIVNFKFYYRNRSSKKLYRSGTVNSNTVNSNFVVNSKFYSKCTYELIKDQRF